ncbi:MAG: hypothetical protein IPK22_12525 [Verrucomicrobiaceae bacterium]|nr:hypothetical protein [Verrucomicrobiaceae bacterium]
MNTDLFKAYRKLTASKPQTHEDLLGIIPSLKAHTFRVQRIRYYRFDSRSQILSSVASVGHSPEVSHSLQRGRIAKLFRPELNASSDTFWCKTEKHPVLFERSSKATTPLKCDYSAGVRRMRVLEDCQLLKKEKASKWLDFPLFSSGRFLGKLSCDVEVSGVMSNHFGREVKALWALSRLLAPHLEGIYLSQIHERRESDAVRDILAKLAAAERLEDVFRICTTDIPELFDCKYASIFTASKDTLGLKKLILRRSSYEKLNMESDVASYDLGDDERFGDQEASITCWVSHNKRPLRLHHLGSPNHPSVELLEQLKQFDPRLKWGNKHRDSDDHVSFLGVPINDPRQSDQSPYDSLGVLRLTQKNTDEGEFSAQDQALLEWIVNEHVAPKISATPSQEFASQVLKQLDSFHNVAILESTDYHDFATAVCVSLDDALQSVSGGSRLYVFNLLCEDNAYFFHRAIHQPRNSHVSIESHVGMKHSRLETLTDLALKSGKAVLLLDIERARKQGRIRNVVKGAVCAMASPIMYKGHELGVIVVFSDRYDLELELHGRILSMVASLTFQIIARRQARTFSLALAGLRHDVLTIVDLVSVELLSQYREDSRIQCLMAFLGRLGDAYVQEYPLNPYEFQSQLCSAEVPVMRSLELAKEAAIAEVSKDSTVKITCSKDLRPVYCDPMMIAITYNLLKNALKFSPDRSEVTVSAATHCDSFGKHWLRVMVQDQGGGMTDEVAEAVRSRIKLDQLVNVESMLSGKDRINGKGLLIGGLLASHYRIIDGRQGKLELVQTSPNGSVFCLDLPSPLEAE